MTDVTPEHMKLLRVIRNTNPESGGPVEGLLRSSEILLRGGHEVEVVSLEPEEDVAKRDFPFPVVALGSGIGKYGYNPRLTPWIKENARRFDAVVLHGLWNYSSYGAWRALRSQSTPYYMFSHGMMDPWFRSRYPLKHLAKIVYWWLGEGRALRDAAAVLFTSDEEMVRARRVFYGHFYKERVVHYGTSGPTGDVSADKAAFFQAFPSLRDRRFLLYLSRIHPKKGCDLLIQAFAKCQDKIAPDIDLVIAGPDQTHWVIELQDLAKRLAVNDRIHWCGMLVGPLKWGAFHCADALVLPSHQENFGIAVAEAMACSTPVLISDKVNIWREVEAAKAGLVQSDTEEGTRNLILNYCALSVEERSQMGKAASQGFKKYFDSEVAARDFARVIGFAPREEVATLPDKIRVLQVIRNTDPESGGPIEALLRTSEVMLREGHEVEVVSLEPEKDAASRCFPFPVIGLGSGITRYGYNSQFAPWIRRNADRFDAVILHGLWNYSSFGAWRGLRKQAVPYFIYSHGMMDPWFRKHYPLKHLTKIVYWWLIEGRALRDASGVLFTCEEERVRARRVFYGHSYKECVIRFGTADPNGNGERERAEFYRVFPDLRQKRFLLFMSRIHPKKGCEILLQAFAEAAASAHSDLDLVIAGPDQVGWIPELKSNADRLGISNRVHWPGMLKGDVKWGAFRSAEAMILPSHQENFGFVVAEAMACSTPVLISDKVNIWREVLSSQAGFVEADTLEGTRNLIRRFLAVSPEEHSQMRRAARQGFLRHFDVEATAADLLELIRSAKVGH
jgi:glycosyltransferase involved in cell wall biosynthesis